VYVSPSGDETVFVEAAETVGFHIERTCYVRLLHRDTVVRSTHEETRSQAGECANSLVFCSRGELEPGEGTGIVCNQFQNKAGGWSRKTRKEFQSDPQIDHYRDEFQEIDMSPGGIIQICWLVRRIYGFHRETVIH
jgi:hypothetical protein